MIGILRIYEAMGHIMWELEVADPDFDGKLVRLTKGQWQSDSWDDLERVRYALQQAWKYAGKPENNRRGQLPG